MAMNLASQSDKGGRRARRRHASSALVNEINVTPMVDVMLVLLIIFMVAAPLLTVGIALDLPETAAGELTTETKPVSININAEGDIYLFDQKTSKDELRQSLAALHETNPDQKIYVYADLNAKYDWVSQVIGEVQFAGFKKVSLPTLPEPEN